THHTRALRELLRPDAFRYFWVRSTSKGRHFQLHPGPRSACLKTIPLILSRTNEFAKWGP
ncbi:MAG: hypothetical protein ACK55Z_29050, partial [bacterium]